MYGAFSSEFSKVDVRFKNENTRAEWSQVKNIPKIIELRNGSVADRPVSFVNPDVFVLPYGVALRVLL